MKKKISLLLSLALMASTVTGFGTGSNSLAYAESSSSLLETKVIPGNENVPNPAKYREGAGDTLTVFMYDLGKAFLPIYSSTTKETQIGNLIFDTLYTNNEKGDFNIPKLADSYEYSSDYKSLTFNLKKSVKWSDGKPFTAKDVENTFLLLADGSYDGRYTNVVDRLKGYESFNAGNTNVFEGIKIIDDYTITFSFEYADVTNFANVAAFPIMPAHIYTYKKGQNNKIKELQKKMVIVGCGRYILQKYDSKGIVKLKANPNWYGGKVSVPNINAVFSTEYDVFDGLDMGYIDIAPEFGASSSADSTINDIGYVTRNEYLGNSYGYVGLNLRDKRLSELSVRQALAYGLNRQYFIDYYYEGYGEICNIPIAKVSWAYTDDVNQYEYNPQKANQILEKAGWKKGKDGIRSKNGKKLSFTWETYTGSRYAETLTTIAKSDWSKIGVSVKPHFLEFNELVNKVYTERKFDMYNMSWSLSVDPTTRDVFHSKYDVIDGNNSIGLRNAEVDKLADAIDREFDQMKRTELFHKYAKKINELVPYIFVAQDTKWDCTNVRVRNYKVSPFCDWTYHIEDVEIQK